MTVLVASDALVAGEVRVVRLESALGPCVQGLHEKREKVPHPGLQHVYYAFLNSPTSGSANATENATESGGSSIQFEGEEQRVLVFAAVLGASVVAFLCTCLCSQSDVPLRKRPSNMLAAVSARVREAPVVLVTGVPVTEADGAGARLGGKSPSSHIQIVEAVAVEHLPETTGGHLAQHRLHSGQV